MYRVRHHDPASFRECAQPWLMQAEAEHALLLGIVAELAAPRHRYEGPPYLVTVENAGGVVGCGFRTPPFKLGVTRMPEAAVAPLADDAGAIFANLPAVMGPPAAATAFGRLWCARRGGAPAIGMRQGIFELTALRPPPRRAAGSIRPARPDELAIITLWCAEFAAEAGTPIGDPARTAAHFIDRSELYVWDHGGGRCMTVATGRTPTGVRIGLVYTPPESRGRGYATTMVADLSAAQLAAGRRACFLYTDLANPTSNGIYERLGYLRVAEAIDVILENDATN